MSAPDNVKARGMVHKLVADTAKELAATAYEGMALRHDDFYQYWPDQKKFVQLRWQSFVQPAREQLAEMLGLPDSMVSQEQKRDIYDALLKNAAVNPAINSLQMPFDA